MPIIMDITRLDEVLKRTISGVEGSKEQVFDIAEQAQHESLSALEELEHIKREVADLLHQNDEREIQFQESRQRLVQVSRGFQEYSEEDVKVAYDYAHQLQVDLVISREKETNLRNRRDSLERRLKSLTLTIEKADNIMTQMSFVSTYLKGQLKNVNIAAESVNAQRMFPIQIIQAQEEERRRVARDIHDGPAQSMANVVVRSDLAERLLREGRIEEVQVELSELKETVRDALGEVRKIIFDLRPMALDDLGLIPTMRKYIDNFGERYEKNVELVTIGEIQRLPETIEVVIFRMIQEAMNNTAKHAEANSVQVQLTFESDQITGQVKDDGVGFEYKDKTGSPAFGIMGMEERMKLLGGSMTIDSKKGEGTCVSFLIPFKS